MSENVKNNCFIDNIDIDTDDLSLQFVVTMFKNLH